MKLKQLMERSRFFTEVLFYLKVILCNLYNCIKQNSKTGGKLFFQKIQKTHE